MTTSSEERRHGGIATSQVEYQMRFHDIMARAAAHADPEVKHQKIFEPFLTISREAGSGGAEVARRVGDRLNWAVLDKELVDSLASDLAKDITNKTFFVGGGRIAEMKMVTAAGVTKTDDGGLWTPQEVSEKMSEILLPE